MINGAIADLLDARFTTNSYHQRTNSSVPTNHLLDMFGGVAEDVFGDTVEMKIFPSTNVPAPTNRFGGQAKVLGQEGGKKRYVSPVHAYNELPVGVMTSMYLEMDDRPEVQQLGKDEIARQMKGFRGRHNLLRTVSLAKSIFDGKIYRNVDGAITETEVFASGTIDLEFNGTTNGGKIDRANFSNFQNGTGDVIDKKWSDPTTDILTQIDDLKELAEHTGQEVFTDIIVHPRVKRYLRNNTGIKDWVKANLGQRADTVLKGDIWTDIGGVNWHFFGGTYKYQDPVTGLFTTYTTVPANKAAFCPPIERDGWFRAINGCFPVGTKSGNLGMISGEESSASLSGSNQIVYGDFFYLFQDDNPGVLKIRGGTTFLYYFANPDCLWVPTIEF